MSELFSSQLEKQSADLKRRVECIEDVLEDILYEIRYLQTDDYYRIGIDRLRDKLRESRLGSNEL